MRGVLFFRAGKQVRPIVAGHTLSCCAGVIHGGRRERGKVFVATVALRGGGYMVCRLRQSFAARCVAR